MAGEFDAINLLVSVLWEEILWLNEILSVMLDLF